MYSYVCKLHYVGKLPAQSEQAHCAYLGENVRSEKKEGSY